MTAFRLGGILLMGAASWAVNGCKSSGSKLLEVEKQSLEESQANTNADQEAFAPEGAMADESTSLASEAESATAPKAEAASAAGATIVLEKTDRFGNVYRLDSAGNLYRYFGGSLKCQVTNNVMDFKVNMHLADEAVVYLVRQEGSDQGVLYALMDSPTYGDSQCPKSVKIKAMTGLTGNVNDKYKIVSNTKDYELGTSATTLAINGYGDLVGWRGRAAVFRNNPATKYADLVMNTCYGIKNNSFSSYMAFALEKNSGAYHRVLKIKGRNTVAESKYDTRTWKNVQDFKAYYKVCSAGNDVYPPPPPPPQIFTKLVDCASSQYRFNVCDTKIGGGFINSVVVATKYSKASCILGQSFGSDSRSIWVADGCRASFRVTYQPSYY